MRADRLLSLLMLLQARGKMTAKALAKELEVCERTIYRDMEALSSAGVPVYGESGPDGGFALVESYRTNLTGLTDGEVRALFMLRIPAPLVDLGIGHELRDALLKLSAALPATRRGDEQRVRERFYLDAAWWREAQGPVPHLQAAYRALWNDRKLHLKHRPMFQVELEQVVDPLGLVAKAGVWYLVSWRHGQIRVHRVSDLLDARVVEEPCERPADFDLVAFWQGWCAAYKANQQAYAVRVRVHERLMPFLPSYFGVTVTRPPSGEGHLIVQVHFESLETARERLLALGGGVEVLEPLALRLSIMDFARQTLDVYERHG